MTKYITGNPFENIKVILNTLIGSPRYHFKPNKESGSVVAHNEFHDNVFEVVKGTFPIDHEYAESILGCNNLSDYKEFGKLFFSYGSALINEIMAMLVKRDYAGTAFLLSQERVSINKLAIAYKKFESEFNKMLNIDQETNILTFAELINNIDYSYQYLMEKDEAYIETGRVLSYLYGALTIYLTGVVINIASKSGVSVESLYSDESRRNIEILSNNLISMRDVEEENKYKLITVFYLYHLMTDFYSNNIGFSIVSQSNRVLYELTSKLFDMDIKELEELLDLSMITQSELNTEDNESFLSNYFNNISVIENPYSFDASLRKYDNCDKAAVAGYIRYYLNPNLPVIRENYKPVLENILKVDTVSESTIDILYNHFIDTVVSAIPKDISPRYFYRVTAYAAAFRKIKNMNKSAKITEQASLGLYQAESILVFLYKTWVMCKGYYRNITTGIYFKNPLRVAQDEKVKAFINNTLYSYSEYVYSTNEDLKSESKISISFFANDRMITAVDLCDEVLPSISKCECFNEIDLPIVTEYESERYDELVEKLNANKISFIEFLIHCETVNDKPYGFKFVNQILESDYEQKSIDLLSSIPDDNNEYNVINGTKLGNIFKSNIKSIIKNEKNNERFVMYFNVFLKYFIPLFMIKNDYDDMTGNSTDALGNTRYEEENYLPNLKSQRLFNFMSK